MLCRTDKAIFKKLFFCMKISNVKMLQYVLSRSFNVIIFISFEGNTPLIVQTAPPVSVEGNFVRLSLLISHHNIVPHSLNWRKILL